MSLLIIPPLVVVFTIVVWNMYLPISSSQNAEFLDYAESILLDHYSKNKYIQDYLDTPVVKPIQGYLHSISSNNDITNLGPRPLQDYLSMDKDVVLTFYVQYGNQKYLLDLLDLLETYDIRKAVFFFEQRYIDDHEFIIKKVQHSGYLIKPWMDLSSYDESPYHPSVYKNISLIQSNILTEVNKDRIAANFLNVAVHNQQESIVAFTPEIMEHKILLEEIVKQNGRGLIFKDTLGDQQGSAGLSRVSLGFPDDPPKNYSKPDLRDSLPLKIRSGIWTMETLQNKFPSIVTYIEEYDSFLVKDPIIIHKGAELEITDAKVLLSTASSLDQGSPSYIRILGNGLIQNSTISSWDLTSLTPPSVDPYSPRPYLVVTDGGRLDIYNSTISHLGYSLGGLADTRFAKAALEYHDSQDFTIANSTIAFNYYGFYSENSDNFRIIGNKIYGQTGYGLDPHTRSANFVIDSNHIHDNGKQGIICSISCHNVTVTNNLVEYNVEGIGLHWLTNSSTIKDNIVRYNDKYGIFIQKTSFDNTIENNTVINNKRGIGILDGSDNNIVVNNIVSGNYLDAPIYVSPDSRLNRISGNYFSPPPDIKS